MNDIRNDYVRKQAALDNYIAQTRLLKFILWIAVVILSLIATVTFAQASSLEIGRGVYTHHYVENSLRNEENELNVLTYRFDDSDWGVMGATFVNSWNVDTQALALTYSVIKWRAVEFELIVGMTKGYTEWELHDKLCPFGEGVEYCFLVAPKLSVELFEYKGVTPKLSVVVLGEAVAVTVGVSYAF